MTSFPTIEEYASMFAGNWRKFESFCWHAKPDTQPDDWAIVYTHNRDSGPLDRANASEIDKALARYMDGDDDEPDVVRESHNHWAVGHVDGFAIRVYRDGKITDAFRDYYDLAARMDDYPILDEEAHSREQQEEIDAAWASWVRYDFVSAVRKMYGIDLDDFDDSKVEECWCECVSEDNQGWTEDSSGMTINVRDIVRENERRIRDFFFSGKEMYEDDV